MLGMSILDISAIDIIRCTSAAVKAGWLLAAFRRRSLPRALSRTCCRAFYRTFMHSRSFALSTSFTLCRTHAMSPIDVFALLGMIATPTAAIFGALWWNAHRELQLRRELSRPGYDRGYPDRAFADRDADRDRLERSVEAIALEVERITEGQRFMAKLLAERSGLGRAGEERSQLPSPAPRSITPH
jgi:hypothetical protein